MKNLFIIILSRRHYEVVGATLYLIFLRRGCLYRNLTPCHPPPSVCRYAEQSCVTGVQAARPGGTHQPDKGRCYHILFPAKLRRTIVILTGYF